MVGGSGFLGLRIARQAQLAGHRVIATCHASAPPAVDVDWRSLDIRRRDDVTALTGRERATPGTVGGWPIRCLTR